MPGFRAKIRVGILIIVVVGICLAASYGLLNTISNGCIMTYMYPTYIPISSTESVSPAKYSLYLYHEGWKKIDFKEHLKKLSGVPVLFIPGNGGSYRQARSSFFAWVYLKLVWFIWLLINIPSIPFYLLLLGKQILFYNICHSHVLMKHLWLTFQYYPSQYSKHINDREI